MEFSNKISAAIPEFQRYDVAPVYASRLHGRRKDISKSHLRRRRARGTTEEGECRWCGYAHTIAHGTVRPPAARLSTTREEEAKRTNSPDFVLPDQAHAPEPERTLTSDCDQIGLNPTRGSLATYALPAHTDNIGSVAQACPEQKG